MGLFGKKKVTIPDGIRVCFYEGPLEGFEMNGPAQLLLQDESIRITRVNPEVTVNLARERITSVEHVMEKDYMGKYHGDAISTSKTNMPKWFLVIHFTSKAGIAEKLAFWSVGAETMKINKLVDELKNNIAPKSYDI